MKPISLSLAFLLTGAACSPLLPPPERVIEVTSGLAAYYDNDKNRMTILGVDACQMVEGSLRITPQGSHIHLTTRLPALSAKFGDAVNSIAMDQAPDGTLRFSAGDFFTQRYASPEVFHDSRGRPLHKDTSYQKEASKLEICAGAFHAIWWNETDRKPTEVRLHAPTLFEQKCLRLENHTCT